MAQKNKEPNCASCPDRPPEILAGNYTITLLLERYGVLMVGAYGDISAEGIRMSLESEPWIDKNVYGNYVRKLIVYLTTALQTQSKDN